MKKGVPKEILIRRDELRREIKNALKSVKSHFTVSDVEQAIYEEQEPDDYSKLLMMFDTGAGDSFEMLQNNMDLLTDAWNLFPHRSINGLCPEEFLVKDVEGTEFLGSEKSDVTDKVIDDINMNNIVHINVKFDETLTKITGNNNIPMIMSAGANFGFLLESVDIEYPEIFQKFKPGELKFSVNGYPPKYYSPLFDGDEINFEAIKN